MKLEDLGEIYDVDMRIRVCETHRRQEPEFRIELGTMECETSVVPWYQWVIVIWPLMTSSWWDLRSELGWCVSQSKFMYGLFSITASIWPLLLPTVAKFLFLSTGFLASRVPQDLDAIVIGSGIGGLSIAVLLSKVGKKVLVLEQHDRAGGCCHTFSEKGFEFDVGENAIVWVDSARHAMPIPILKYSTWLPYILKQYFSVIATYSILFFCIEKQNE